jgi:hypothetical protein
VTCSADPACPAPPLHLHLLLPTLVHCCYTVYTLFITLLLHCLLHCYTVVTKLSHCGYTVVTRCICISFCLHW